MRSIDLTGDGHAHVHGRQEPCEVTGGRKQPAESVFARKQLERERQPGAGGGSSSWCLGHTPTECFISAVEGRRASARLNISAPWREAGRRPRSWPFIPSGLSPTRRIIAASEDAALHALVLFVSFNKHSCPTTQCGEAGEGGRAPGCQGGNVGGNVSAG